MTSREGVISRTKSSCTDWAFDTPRRFTGPTRKTTSTSWVTSRSPSRSRRKSRSCSRSVRGGCVSVGCRLWAQPSFIQTAKTALSGLLGHHATLWSLETSSAEEPQYRKLYLCLSPDSHLFTCSSIFSHPSLQHCPSWLGTT